MAIGKILLIIAFVTLTNGINITLINLNNFYFLFLGFAIRNSVNESWGYFDIRPNAHMFWWLYSNTQPLSQLPLVIWLQGGPGASSTGYGNFEEIGPLDTKLKPRNTSWIQYANLLFIDNPVGTGFSYVDNINVLTKNNSQIADDLVTFMKLFYKRFPNLQVRITEISN